MLDKAILMYKKALKITEQQKDYTLSAIISSNIATLYNELEENQKAIVFSRRFFSYPQTDTLAFDYQINKISYLCNHAILLTNGKYYKNAIDSLQLATRLLQDNYISIPITQKHYMIQEKPNQQSNITRKP